MQLKRGGLKSGLNIGICTCGAQLEMVQLESITGNDEGVTVTFDGLSCLECPQDGHLRLYPYWAYSEGDFYKTIIEWFTDPGPEKQSPFVWPKHASEVTSWLGFRTTYTCAECSSRLDKNSIQNRTLTGHVEPGVIPPVDLSLEVPFVTCPSCHQTQMYGDPSIDGSNLNQKIKQAILSALQNGNMQP